MTASSGQSVIGKLSDESKKLFLTINLMHWSKALRSLRISGASNCGGGGGGREGGS